MHWNVSNKSIQKITMKLGAIQGAVIFIAALALTAEPSDALLGSKYLVNQPCTF